MTRTITTVIATVAVQLLPGQAIAQATSWVVGGQGGEPWANAVQQWIALDDSVQPGSVQPLQLKKGANLIREPVRTSPTSRQLSRFGYRWTIHKGPRQIEADTLQVGWHPRLWDNGEVNARANNLSLVDGDELTAAITHNRSDAQERKGDPSGLIFYTIDLAVPVPIDSIVFFPPQSGINSENQRQRELFPSSFEVSRTNMPVEWLIFEDETTSVGSAGYHALDDIVATAFANNKSIVSLSTDLAFTRFLRFRWGQELRTILVAEIKAFGRGYPQEARYVSAPHFFGTPVSLGRVDWSFTRYREAPSGEIFEDPDAPVELVLRTRAGSDEYPTDYFIFDDLGRSLLVDKTTYFRAPRVDGRFSEGVPGFRARRADDITNWNNWSVPYERSGAENRSSDGSKYLQFSFEIVTEDPMTFGVLDSLSFEVSPLLADSAIAEVSLDGVPLSSQGEVEVPMGVDTLFAYDLRTVAGDTALSGYDGVELSLPAGARFVDLEIEGVAATEGTDFELTQETNRIALTFPAVIQQDRAMRIRFRSAIFQASQFLEARISNSGVGDQLPQSIEAGDARDDVNSNGVQVIASDTRFGVLRDIRLSTPVVTPNDDEINDDTRILFDLFGVQDGVFRVEVFDLAGRRVRNILADRASSGAFGAVWDGTDDDRQVVAPGMYLIRVEIDVDEGTVTRVEPVAVAY